MIQPVVVIRTPEIRAHHDGKEIAAEVHIAGVRHILWFRLPADIPADIRMDPFVITLLATAMNLGADVIAEGELSPAVVEAIPRFQTIFHRWYPTLRIARISGYSLAATDAPDGARRTVSFFSGGVDSFHTILRHRDRIDDAILVHGFDFSLENTLLRNTVRARLQKAADEMNKPLIEVETNSREITEPHAAWPRHQYGNALAGIGHLLGRHANRVLIPSSDTYECLIPWGSHPLTDTLWQSERLAIEHDGADCSRLEKVRFLSAHDAALHHLRVCWRNPGNAYNCGVCEKCVRTQLELLASGLLERCPVFSETITAHKIAEIVIPAQFGEYYVEILRALRETGAHQEIIHALADVLERYQQKQLGQQLAASALLHADVSEVREGILRHEQALMRILLTRGHAHVLRLWMRTLRADLTRRMRR